MLHVSRIVSDSKCRHTRVLRWLKMADENTKRMLLVLSRAFAHNIRGGILSFIIVKILAELYELKLGNTC